MSSIDKVSRAVRGAARLSSPNCLTLLCTSITRGGQTRDTSIRGLDELALRIDQRYEDWQARQASGPTTAVAPGSLPALTLRNTVQPSSNSMGSSSHLDEDESAQLARLVRVKEGKKDRFKRAFQLKGRSKPGSGEASMPSSQLNEPQQVSSTSGAVDLAWQPVQFPGSEAVVSGAGDGTTTPGQHTSSRDRSPVLVRRRPATRDSPARQTTLPLPLPGEDGDDLGLPVGSGIEYLGAGSVSRSASRTELAADPSVR